MSAFLDCTDPLDTASRTAAVGEVVAVVGRGGVVVLPTDARYGIGCDAFRPDAVSRLRRARGSGRHAPPPVLVGSRHTLAGLTPVVTDRMAALTERFWPGPLTLVVPQVPSLAWDLGDTRGTVAVRMPLHPIALAVLALTGPMAVTGANRVGWPPPADARAAREQLGDAVDLYVEAGVLHGSSDPLPAAASTIVDLVSDVPRLVRPGALATDRLREVLPDLVVAPVPWSA